MLPPAARLRRRVDFVATTRGGRRAARGALVVHLAHQTRAGNAVTVPTSTTASGSGDTPADTGIPTPVPGSTPTARIGFAVSRAVGGAVVRNRVRRRLRHLVRERLDELPAGATLVVRALPTAAERSYQELGRDLDAALAAARAPRRPHRDRSPHQRAGRTRQDQPGKKDERQENRHDRR